MERDSKGRFVKGGIPWTKGKKGIHLSPATEFKKGIHYSPATEFKKGENLREEHRNWKGGRTKLKIGYIWKYAPNHPRAYRNGVYEHILVAEKKIGRFLEKKECVHHINGIKDDNRPENIVVCLTNAEHKKCYHRRKRCGC